MTEYKTSLQDTITTDSRDWSANSADAWIYGIVAGWGSALNDVAQQHEWDSDTVDRLCQLHAEFMQE